MVTLPDGTTLPRIGQGTWYMGDEPSKKNEELRTLRRGVELGLNLIDSAEMYGDGRSESLVGEAIEGIRDQVFLVSKVYPHNAGLSRIVGSCEQKLEAVKDGPSRPLSSSLERKYSSKRNGRSDGAAGRSGENFAMGRLEPGHG
ncbi:aldo/keto reductase [Actinobacillus pleuropneumoniae]|nr:aldo/keto reductase [Actinobacillus pleuropneumoniae]